MSMQGLIWGLVRLDRQNAKRAELDDLTAAVSAEAAIGPVSVQGLGPGFFASAALLPTGSKPGPPAASTADARSLFTLDARFYACNARPAPTINADLRAALLNKDTAQLAAIHGDFAAAAWLPDQRTLRLVRDAMGVRPLFYVHRMSEYLAFCSLNLPLVLSGLARPDTHLPTVVSRAAKMSAHGVQTPVSDIKRVLAGHVVDLVADGWSMTRYWQAGQPKRLSSHADPHALARKARAVLTEAVRRRLPETGAVAAECSGGLDSSSIAVLAADMFSTEDRVVAGYHYGAPDRRDVSVVDGANHAAALAQHAQNLQITVVPAPDTAQAGLAALEADIGVFTDRTNNNFDQSLAEISDRGIPILFAGYGGDETLSGKGQGTLTEALHTLDLNAFSDILRQRVRKEGKNRWAIAVREVAKLVVPARLQQKLRDRRQRNAPVGQAFLKAMLTAKGQAMLPDQTPPVRFRDHQHKLLFDGRMAANAEVMAVDAARHGIAVALPFYDRDLVDFALALPLTVFHRDGMQRWLLRAAMDGALPEMVRTRHTKLPQQNIRLLSLAEHREAYLSELDRLAKTKAAELFNIPAMRAIMETLPETSAALDDIEEAARHGEVPDQSAALFLIPFVAARFAADAQ